MSDRNRKRRPGVSCVFCGKHAEVFGFKIKGTVQAWVCGSCAEKHPAQIESVEEEPSNRVTAKEG
jgi:transcription elongation factor Elf1